MAKQKYKVNTATNFSIGDDEFYLKVGDEVELPEHELIASMVTHKHLSPISTNETETHENN